MDRRHNIEYRRALRPEEVLQCALAFWTKPILPERARQGEHSGTIEER